MVHFCNNHLWPKEQATQVAATWSKPWESQVLGLPPMSQTFRKWAFSSAVEKCVQRKVKACMLLVPPADTRERGWGVGGGPASGGDGQEGHAAHNHPANYSRKMHHPKALRPHQGTSQQRSCHLELRKQPGQCWPSYSTYPESQIISLTRESQAHMSTNQVNKFFLLLLKYIHIA